MTRHQTLDLTNFESCVQTVVSEVWSDYDGDSVYGDFDPGSGSTTASHEPGMWQSTGGVDDYLHNDMIGTLRMTTIGSGPEAGTPDLDRVFTAFGERITGPIDRNGYAGAWGYQSHDVSGAGGSAVPFDFLHVGARYYDPSSGRFLQRDPIGIGGGLDVYAYVGNRPTARTDPSGLGPVISAIYATFCFGLALKGAYDLGEDIADSIYGDIDEITIKDDGTIIVDGEEWGHVPETPAERNRDRRERERQQREDDLDRLKGLPGVG